MHGKTPSNQCPLSLPTTTPQYFVKHTVLRAMISASRQSRDGPRRLAFNRRSLKENFYRAPTLDDMCEALDIEAQIPPHRLSFSLQQGGPEGSLDDKLIRLNVGGRAYRLLPETILRRSAESLLTEFVFASHPDRMRLCTGWLAESREYYFERSPELFEIVYQFYISGMVHKPAHVCLDVFVTELAFWNIKKAMFSSCATNTNGLVFRQPKEKKHMSFTDSHKHMFLGDFRRKVWNLMEVPESSVAARVMAWFSLGSILLVTILMVMASIPEFQVNVNITRVEGNHTETMLVAHPHPAIEYAEHLCMLWFTIEYLTKLLATADRKQYFFHILSLVDLISIVPFYFELTMMLANVELEGFKKFNAALVMMRVLRVSRVIRILKVGRYSSGIRALALTMSASKKQLSMLGVVLATATMFFSTLLYNLEKDEPSSKFTTIPAAFWWCIVTMTTVGYGDMVPTTIGGKLVGTGAIACGVLVLALPITIIVDNFMQVHEQVPPTAYSKSNCQVVQRGLTAVAQNQHKAFEALVAIIARRQMQDIDSDVVEDTDRLMPLRSISTHRRGSAMLPPRQNSL